MSFGDDTLHPDNDWSVVKDRPTVREAVYKVIDGEREYQESLGGDRTEGTPHTVGNFLVMMQAYMARAVEAWTMNPGNGPALENIRKIAGIAVQCMEKHGAPERKKAS